MVPAFTASAYVVMPEKTRISATGSVVTTTSVSKPGGSVQTEESPRSRTIQIRVGSAPAVVELDDGPVRRQASVTSRRDIHQVSVTGSTSRGSGSLNIQRTAHSPTAMITPSRSRPAGVSRYSWPRPWVSSTRSTTPLRSRWSSRCLSSEREMPGSPRSISLKRRPPSTSSRTMSGIHRSAMTELASATGQYWS